MHHRAEREAGYKASRGLCWVAENLGAWSAETLAVLSVEKKFSRHKAACLGGSSWSLSAAFLARMQPFQDSIKCSFWVSSREKLASLDSGMTVLPSWCMCWGSAGFPPFSCHVGLHTLLGLLSALASLRYQMGEGGPYAIWMESSGVLELFLADEKFELFLKISFGQSTDTLV